MPRALELKFEEIVGRKPHSFNAEEFFGDLRNKRVLLTGAGGTVGLAITEAFRQFPLKALVLFERNEAGLFRALKACEDAPFEVIPFLGSVLSSEDIKEVFSRWKPEVVLHGAAYKHVCLLENFPEKAFLNNVEGTELLLSEALRCKTERLVYFSSDKAVEPASAMGASKCIAEKLVLSVGFVAVRFGNVFASSGSAVEVFLRRLKESKPLIIHHPEVCRFFMSQKETVLLVLEALRVEGPAVLALDMGEPVKILDLAKALARAAGVEPWVRFGKLGPGEKVRERVFWPSEGPVALKRHLLYAKAEPSEPESLEEALKHLGKLAREKRREKLRREMLRWAWKLSEPRPPSS